VSPSGYRDCFPDSSLFVDRKLIISGHNLLLILIRQMASLVRRGLAEVCAVPVLLVNIFFNFSFVDVQIQLILVHKFVALF